jgi:glycosyltransferase involved in cell wall biosynthesis
LNDSPRVSVILPVFNAGAYLAPAIDSLTGQTFRDIEILVFDDGSTDGSAEKVAAIKDSRVRLFRDDKNRGYVKRLNQGLEQARGEYVARMDADDICLPERLEKQVRHMEANRDLVLLGCSADTIDAQGKTTGRLTPPVFDGMLRWKLLFDNPFIHPSVMFRLRVVREADLAYREDLQPSEDFEMWNRLAELGRIENLPESLIRYRTHPDQVSDSRRTRQLECHAGIIEENMERHFPSTSFPPDRIAGLRDFAQGALAGQIDASCRNDVLNQFCLSADLMAAKHPESASEIVTDVRERLFRSLAKERDPRTKWGS